MEALATLIDKCKNQNHVYCVETTNKMETQPIDNKRELKWIKQLKINESKRIEGNIT